MVRIREYRIPLPITVEDYHIAQLYSVALASKNETGGGEGVQILENRPYTDDQFGGSGQYTHKKMFIQSKVPYLIRKIAPEGSLILHEKAWNAYPYCRTVYTNEYMKEDFHIIIDSWHLPDAGTTENVHGLKGEELEKRTVDFLNIADNSEIGYFGKYKENEDPTKFSSKKTLIGPLAKDWAKTSSPVMCCYKLYRVLFKWKLLQNRTEDMIIAAVRDLLLGFHRQLFTWMDDWYGMTILDIRALEEKTKQELDDDREKGELRGIVL